MNDLYRLEIHSTMCKKRNLPGRPPRRFSTKRGTVEKNSTELSTNVLVRVRVCVFSFFFVSMRWTSCANVCEQILCSFSFLIFLSNRCQ